MDTRLVWLTREQRDWLVRAGSLLHPQHNVLLSDEIVAAYDAAPADSAEAVERGILDTFPDLKGVRISLSIDHSERAATACARRVLAALGGPKGTR